MKLTGVFIFFAFLTVQAQLLEEAANDAIGLELGTLSRSVLDDQSPQNFKDGSRYALFRIDLEQGKVAELRVISDFDAYSTLYGPSLELLQTNDEADDSDGDESNYESVIVSEASESGTHLLVVSGYYETSVGSFEVSAKDIPVVDEAVLVIPATINAVLNNTDDTDEDGRYYDNFVLVLERPSTIILTMHSDAIDSYLKIFDQEIFDASEALIAENDDKVFVDDPATTDVDESSDYTLDAELELELEAGNYQIQALSYSTGFYQLFVQGEGGEATPLTPTKPSKPGAKPGN
jgi:hypothetical protein